MKKILAVNRWTSIALFLLGIALLGPASALAGPPSTLYNFSAVDPVTGTNADGAGLQNALTAGKDGSLYGIAYGGGAYNNGTVFKITTNGAFTLLYSLSETNGDGDNPDTSLTLGTNGNFYGTTGGGPDLIYGTMFDLSTDGTPAGTALTTIYAFGFGLAGTADGIGPSGTALDSQGNLYGTAGSGGTNNKGTVFKVTTDGTYDGTTLTPLHWFGSLDDHSNYDGEFPRTGLTLGSDGNFYGVTARSPFDSSEGAVFQVSPAGAFTTLHVFTTSDDNGSDTDSSGLVEGPSGTFYGMNSIGGSNVTGTVFQITSGGTFTRLYTFSAPVLAPFATRSTNADGANPIGGLVKGADGSFYGATSAGGAYGGGTLFRMTTDGTPGGTVLATLYSFTTNRAIEASPDSAMTLGADGFLYGTTRHGSNGTGSIFKFDTTGPKTLPPTTVTNFGTIVPGGPIYFFASQSSTVSGLIVRIQYSTTPTVEGSWTDLPDGNGGHLQLLTAGVYAFGTSGTLSYPGGTNIYFRAITSAPGYQDSISTKFLGPYTLYQGQFTINVRLTSTSDPTGKLQITHIGDELTYTFIWTNIGNLTAKGVQVETLVPTYIDAASDLLFQFPSNDLVFKSWGHYVSNSSPGAKDAKVVWNMSDLKPGYSQAAILGVQIGSMVRVTQQIGENGDNYRIYSISNQPPTGATGSSSGSANVETTVLGPNKPLQGAGNFLAVPASPGQTWTFSLTDTSTVAGLSVVVEASPDGVIWTAMQGGSMTRSTSKPTLWTLATDAIPDGSHYFRALSSAPGFLDTPSPAPWFSNYLAIPTALKLSTKLPAKSGQQWTFGATLAGSANLLSVRFQATTTPTIEGSWSDLPEYTATTKTGSTSWIFVTYNIPAGILYFRAIASAPGWVDGISAPPYKTMTVQASALTLPAVTGFTITPNGPVYAGDSVVFTASSAFVKGAAMQFQSKLSSDTQESSWTDLTVNGVLSHAGDKWTLTTGPVPIGVRDFRAVASATAYLASVSATQSLTINGPRLPHTAAAFTDFIAPTPDKRVYATGDIIDVQIGVTDKIGLQTVKLQVAGAKTKFTDVANGQMAGPNSSGIYENDHLVFTAPGTYYLRVLAIDNYSPPPVATNISDSITLLIGAGGGTSAPTFGVFANKLVQSTLQAKGSVTISVPVFDDKQVYRTILFRADSSGNFAGVVGDMAQATAGDTNVRSITDASLSDGVYYYFVTASDFDGNVSVSGTQGPFTLTTPEPAPPTITINVTPESRLVNSTHPLSGNHTSMPEPDQGTVHFTWSGLSKGTSTITGYRAALPSEHFFSHTTTATSGELTVPAPKIGLGEGAYVIQICPGSGGDPYPTSPDSVKEFTVGHSWNMTTTFTQLDYGLYWFKDVRNGLKALDAGQNDEYFDPNKPTIIYVHGWQANEVGIKRRESWQRLNPNDGTTKYDLCQIWKNQGYNVGLFYWNQFAYEDGIFTGLYQSESKIYGTTGATDSLPLGQGMTYALYDPTTAGQHALPLVGNEGQVHQIYFWNPDQIGNQSVCDLFYNEMVRCLTGYDTSKNELRIIGHSLGTQVIGRTMFLINSLHPPGVPIPTRIALLDLAETSSTSLPDPYYGSTVPYLQKSFLDSLASAGVAIESYQSTDLQSLIGILLVQAKPVFDLTAYERIRPDWIFPTSLPDSHGEAIRWYSESFVYDEFPAYSYWAPFVIHDWIGYAISASSSTNRIRSLMGGHLYFNQTEGKNTPDVSHDGFEELFDRN